MYRIAFCAVILLSFLFGCSAGGGGFDSADAVEFRSWDEYSKYNEQAIVEDSAGEDKQLSQIKTLDECLKYAAANSPELKDAFYQWRRAVEKIAVANSLPDPKISYTYYIEEVETRVGAQQQSVALAQTFPGWGKIKSLSLSARNEANAKWQMFQSKKLELFTRVARGWSELFHIGMAIRVTDEKLEILKQVESILSTRYKTMQADHPDLLRIQIDLIKLDDRLKTYSQRLGVAQAGLNALIGRGASASIGAPTQLEIPKMEGRTFQKLLAAMIKNNPSLKARENLVSAANMRVELAKSQYYPDVTLGAKWIDTSPRSMAGVSENGQDAVMVTLGINIPIWFDRIDAGIRSAQNERKAAGQRLGAQRLALDVRLHDAWFELTEADRKLHLYSSTLIPKASESLEVLQSGFLSGNNSYIDLLDAIDTLLEFELQNYRAQSDYVSAYWQIGEIIGGYDAAIMK